MNNWGRTLKYNFSLAGNDLFEECLEALGNNAVVLSPAKSDDIVDLLEKSVPIYEGGSRIDWNKVDEKIYLDSPRETVEALTKLLQGNIDTSIYLMWNDGELLVIKTDLHAVLDNFDDVTCVSFETWFFNPSQGYIIEYYYLGDMAVGLISKNKI